MNNPPAARKPESNPTPTKPSPEAKNLEAEEESAAAHAEPMGSIAAAVPGSDNEAQDSLRTGRLPGREAPEIRDRPQTTAGTEEQLEEK